MVLLITELHQSLINMLLLIPYLKTVLQNLLFWHDPVSVTKYDCLLYT